MSQGPLKLSFLFRSQSDLKRLNQALSQHQQILTQVRDALPPNLAAHCKATIKQGNKLLIFADSSAWASRLRYATGALAQCLPCDRMGITSFKVSVSLFDIQTTRRRSTRPRRISRENSRLIRQIAANISDAELRTALQRLSKHSDD